MKRCIIPVVIFLIPFIFLNAGSLRRTATPGSRTLSCMITDIGNQRILLFGGSNNRLDNGDYFNDIWSFDLIAETWHLVDVTGTPPTPRWNLATVYDQIGNRMIIFGGEYGSMYFNDVWALDLTVGSEAWIQLSPSGTAPTPRKAITAILDTVNYRMIVFGGYNGSIGFNEVWSLDLNSLTWSLINPTGSPPSARWAHGAVYDPINHQMVVFGGQVGDIITDEVWSLDLTFGSESWQQINPTGTAPGKRKHFPFCYDYVNNELVVAFGYDFVSWFFFYNDMFALDMTAFDWRQVTFGGDVIPGRRGCCAAYDPQNEQVIVHGGDIYPDIYLGDTYAFTTEAQVVEEDQGSRHLETAQITINSNPSNLPVSLNTYIPSPGFISIKIYNVMGRIIKNLIERRMSTGNLIMSWDGLDNQGKKVPNGTYFIRLELDHETVVKKVIVIE